LEGTTEPAVATQKKKHSGKKKRKDKKASRKANK
jgi:hypothetical protein